MPSRATRLAGVPTFDPFRDGELKLLLQAELSAVHGLSAATIKAELAASGLPAIGVVDMADLQQLLAKRRVLLRLRAAQDQAADAALREQRADAIEEEMQQIRASGLSELDMVRELQALKAARIDMERDFVRQLAVTRVRTRAPTSEDDEEPSLAEEIVEGAIGIAVAVPGFLKNASDATQGFVGRLGLTGAEVRAKETIQARNWGPGGRAAAGDSAEGDVNEAQRALAALAADAAFAGAPPEVAFDLVVQWARPYPRAVLAALLVARNEDVPRYATRSDLAAVLADSLLVERCEAYYCDVEIDDFENGITGNRKKAPSRGEGSDPSRSPIPAPSPPPSRRAAVTRPRPASSPLNDPFFFEKDLAAQAWARLCTLAAALLAGPPTDALRAARASVLGALLRAVVFGTKAVRTLAMWAGGDVFAPNHVIFAVTAYCIWARKGLLNFLGCFAAVRVFRELAAVQAQSSAPRVAATVSDAAGPRTTPPPAPPPPPRPRAEQPEADVDDST